MIRSTNKTILETCTTIKFAITQILGKNKEKYQINTTLSIVSSNKLISEVVI